MWVSDESWSSFQPVVEATGKNFNSLNRFPLIDKSAEPVQVLIGVLTLLLFYRESVRYYVREVVVLLAQTRELFDF